MTKHMGLVVALVAAVGVTLATPTFSEAGGFRRCRSYYVAGSTVAAPGYSASYYPTSPAYPTGYDQGGNVIYYSSPVNTSGWYRVGNVIINGRRWGDIGSRYSYGDLKRW